MKKNMLKSLSLWLAIGLIMVLVFNYFNTSNEIRKEIAYSDFIDDVKAGEIKTVVIKDNSITGELKKDDEQFETYAPSDSELVPLLQANGVEIHAKPADRSPWYMTVLISWFPLILLVGIWLFFMRQMTGGGSGGKAFSFGKSKAKLLTPDSMKVTFKDVAGIEEAKEELTEIVDFLKDPTKYQRLGGRLPKGVLLVGSPGTGKTLLAKAVAGEAGVPFFSISGSDFVEMFVGVGAARIRDLFEQGKKAAPCIIFMDEIDAVGRHRGAGLGGGHDEREQTLNALLVEMDGFDSNEGVILVAATNRPDVLDPALLRPGRFDRQIVVPRPDLNGRVQILKVHAARVKMDDTVDFEVIAKGTPGFAGAELANLINESALLAARKNQDSVTMDDVEEAKDKVMMGAERRSMVIPEKERLITAYHEAGHAIVAVMIKDSDPVHKVTIIPRGMALGLTMQLPDEETHMYNKSYILSKITVLLGGRIAEEVKFKSMSTGASNDIERLSSLARKMVMSWGMAKSLGTISFGKRDEAIFLGKEISSQKDYSEKTAEHIDLEVDKIISLCYNSARKVLETNIKFLDATANLLMEKETINRQDLDELVKQYAVGKMNSFSEMLDEVKPASIIAKTKEKNALIASKALKANSATVKKATAKTVSTVSKTVKSSVGTKNNKTVKVSKVKKTPKTKATTKTLKK